MKNQQLLCYDTRVILVNTNIGGLYMLFYAIVSFAYAGFMWYTFYNVPNKFGIVSRRSVEDVGLMIGHPESANLKDEENLKTVVRALEHDRKFTKSQLIQASRDRDGSNGGGTFTQSSLCHQ